MPPANPKNLGMSAAGMDLGLGDQLGQQVQDETEEQRRRRLLLEQMQSAVNPMGAAGVLGLGAQTRR